MRAHRIRIMNKPKSLFRNLPLWVCSVSLAATLGAIADYVRPEVEASLQPQIQQRAEELLAEENFKEIERIGMEYITKKERIPASIWKLTRFADTITKPKDRTDQEGWQRTVERWEKWHKEFNTPFSLTMLGKAHLNHAKNARGDGFANRVSADGWNKMEERLKKAEATLLEAEKKDPENPELYRELLHVGILRGWEKERMDELITKAIKVDPEYYESHFNISYYLMERWHGDKGDWQRYMNSLPKRIEGDEAYIVYARTGIALHPYYKDGFFAEDREDKISWKTMKRGFEATAKKYPTSAINLNRYGFFCYVAGDKETAKEKIKTIEDQKLHFFEVWGGEEEYKKALKWVSEN